MQSKEKRFHGLRPLVWLLASRRVFKTTCGYIACCTVLCSNTERSYKVHTYLLYKYTSPHKSFILWLEIQTTSTQLFTSKINFFDHFTRANNAPPTENAEELADLILSVQLIIDDLVTSAFFALWFLYLARHWTCERFWHQEYNGKRLGVRKHRKLHMLDHALSCTWTRVLRAAPGVRTCSYIANVNRKEGSEGEGSCIQKEKHRMTKLILFACIELCVSRQYNFWTYTIHTDIHVNLNFLKSQNRKAVKKTFACLSKKSQQKASRRHHKLSAHLRVVQLYRQMPWINTVSYWKRKSTYLTLTFQ